MIRFHDVSFEYPGNKNSPSRVIDQLSLTIQDGQYIAIMGPNGSGKSTLAKCFNGLLLPTGGIIEVDGLNTSDLTHLAAIRQKVGIVFQNPENQIVSTSVEREVAFGLENIGVDPKVMHQVVPAILERFHLSHYQLHPPHLLSGGEKQRLALAAVMAMNPKYLVLDEPTSMLDPSSREELLKIIQEIRAANTHKQAIEQITTVLITQFPEESLAAERLIILEQGRILFDDSPQQVFQNIDQLHAIGLQAPIEFEIGPLLAKHGIPTDLLQNF
jgi:energy-coupling factor transport system ATP-binding protein